MGRRWKWFLRVGRAGVDLVGEVVPEGGGSGRSRPSGGLVGVPDESGASRGGGVVGAGRGVRRVGVARNQRAVRYALLPSGECHGRRGSGPGEGRRADG